MYVNELHNKHIRIEWGEIKRMGLRQVTGSSLDNFVSGVT